MSVALGDPLIEEPFPPSAEGLCAPHEQNDLSSEASSPSTTSTSSTTKRWEHATMPTIMDSPELVAACGNAVAHLAPGRVAAIALACGLPPAQRAQAWPLLLAEPDDSHVGEDESPASTDEPAFDENVVKRINGETNRLRTRLERTAIALERAPNGHQIKVPEPEVFESAKNAVLALLERCQGKLAYEPGLLWMAYVLSFGCGNQPIDAKVYEQCVLQLAAPLAEPAATAEYVALFIHLVRRFAPVLSAHFDAELLFNFTESEQWLLWWIKYFGVKVLLPADVARLWDVYFALRVDQQDSMVHWSGQVLDHPTRLLRPLFGGCTDPSLAHVFCCVALLKSLQMQLIELDQSEIRQLLSNMPACKDIEQVLNDADSMWHEWSLSARTSPTSSPPNELMRVLSRSASIT